MQANMLKGEEATKKIAQAEQVLTHRLNEVRHTLTGPKAYIAKLNRADLILSLAQLYLTRREGDDLKKTADLLNQLEHELGEHPRVYQLRGELATVENRIIQAIRYYQKAESLDEGNVLTKLALADLHFRRGETGAAEKILNEVLRQAPDNRGARRLAASVQLVQNNPEKAMEHIDWLLTTVDEENRREPLLLKLEALIRLDRFDEAQTVTNTLAEMGVKVDLRIQRAARLAGEQKYTEAETLLKQVLADEPGNKRATGMVVAIYDQQNRKDDARAIVDQALVQHPDDESFRQMKTLLATDNEEERRRLRDQIRDKSLAEALEVVKEEKDPYRREVAMVNQYLIRNDMKSAKKHLDAAIALDSNRTIRLNFQFALFTKDWNRAEQCVVLAREGNLDGLNGRYYQAQLTSARAWDYANDANQKKPDEAKQTFQQAADQLEPLIAELPDDSLLRALLGEAYVWLDRPDEAESQINEALVLGPENPYVRRAQALRQWLMIAESSVVSNQELASDFVNNVMIASTKLPRDEWLATKRDWIKEQNQLTEEYQDDEKGDPEKVAERREARRKEDPKDLRNLIRLAWVYENREKVKDLDKAEQCHQQAIEQEPVAVVMREYLAFASRHKRMESLEAYLKGLANKFGQNGNGDGYTLLGVYYHSLGQNEPAETSLLQAVKINDNASKQLGLAVFYNRLSQTEKTIEWAQKTLQSAPTAQQDRTARMLLITGLLQTSQWDKAADQIDQYQKSFPGPLGKMYAVRLALAREDVSKAEQILTEVLETNPGYADALDVRAKIFMDTWRLDQAQKDLERLKSISPRGFGNLGHIRLAKLYCELGRPTDAVNEARNVLSAINDRPDWYEPARINLILPLSSSLPDADMVELLIWAGNKQTTYWGWPFERGRLLLRQKKYNDACTAMADAWKLAKDGPMSLRLSVLDQYQQALFQAKRYDEIVRIADSVLAEADSPIPGVLAWRAAALYAKGNHQEAANTYFKSLELAKDQPLVIWQITHEGFLHAISARELIPLLEEKLNSSPNEMKTSLKLALAGTYLSANEIDKGYPLYKEVVSSFSKPVDQTMIWYLASQQFGEQNKQQTVEALREARKLDPDNVAVLNNLAYCLNEDLGQSEEAMKLIKPAYQKSPNNPELLDTYGRIQQKLGQKDQALVSFSRSVWAQEIATSRYHLATLLMELNRDLEARVQLERALVLAEDDKQLESSIRETLKNVRKE
jgi:tetratricopeptide (TPR) repeat protein